MRLTIPTTWNERLLTGIEGLPVENVYGKLATDVVGGGRYPYWLPHVTPKQVKEHVEQAHARGIKVDYLLNPTCMGEFGNRQGDEELEKLFDWIEGLGIDMITVSSADILKAVKKRFPTMRVSISAFQQIRSVEKAKQFESLGVDVITLQDVNRDFKMLEAMRKALSCDIQLVANNSCIYNCPYEYSHSNAMSHSSQSTHEGGGFSVDPAILLCSRSKFIEPNELIRSRWIRPEDLSLYEDIGLDHFKLVDRSFPPDTMVKIVKAYAARRYEGNMLDLLIYPPRDFPLRFGPPQKFRYYVKNFYRANLIKVVTRIGMRLGRSISPIYIDNRKLDGFLARFTDIDCSRTSCDACGYCDRVAERAMTVDEDMVKEQIELYDRVRDELINGTGM